jgi:hypothetical protein
MKKLSIRYDSNKPNVATISFDEQSLIKFKILINLFRITLKDNYFSSIESVFAKIFIDQIEPEIDKILYPIKNK